jgi:hypothetical protein
MQHDVKSYVFIGSYGLISLNSSNPSETIIDSFNPNVVLRDSVREQCLRFYYYFTVYNKTDWGQQIQIWIRPNNETDDQLLLRNLTFTEMKDNKWEFQELSFNSTVVPYTVRCFCQEHIDE